MDRWSDPSLTLPERLDDWTDWDGAAYALGQRLGVIGNEEFLDAKHIFWTDNPLGRALHVILHELVRAGILESRDAGDEFRWKPTT